jgi:hypothetical protein
MSDDLSTVNARRTRELENLRQLFRRHRETLAKLMQETDAAMATLEDLGRPPSSSGASGTSASPPPLPDELRGTPRNRGTQPGMQPLAPSPSPHDDLVDDVERDSRSRLALMLIAGILALALIGAVIWWASKDRAPERPLVDDETTTTATASDTVDDDETATIAPANDPRALLTVTPGATDYGAIRKGTRATRQFEIANNSEEPMSITAARSTCRCLYYEYAPVVPPKAKETITVTIDGAKAAAGPLRETVRISSRSDPTTSATFEVSATIR